MDELLYKLQFPKLSGIKEKKTSEPDKRYNCIAWAFKDNQRWWWPTPKAYWPVSRLANWSPLESFEDWFARDGWTETPNREPEPGFEKVALYAKGGVPTHAARMLDSGLWSSKLGMAIDLVHELGELEGPEYGTLLRVYRRKQKAT